MSITRKTVARLPPRLQQSLKRLYYARQIRRGRFVSPEPEFARLSEWVSEGDWVLDIGANVGHYTVRLAELVGATGRVIALEPIPQTFELLASNAAGLDNVTLLNVAASEDSQIFGTRIPCYDSGLSNYYRAELTNACDGSVPVISVAVDSLRIPDRVGLVKLDVEGHELSALKGMAGLLACDKPVLIVEGNDRGAESFLRSQGYAFTACAGSPNRVFEREEACYR